MEDRMNKIACILAVFLSFCITLSGPRSSLCLGAAQEDNTKIGAYFFYWHNCPLHNCALSKMIYHPTGSYTNYSSLDKTWYTAEIFDMALAGVDYIFPICWGNHPGFSWFHISTLSTLATAITESGSYLKVGLFDDSTSECSDWNYNNGRGYTTNPQMPLDDSNNWAYFYDLKIKPYFQVFPRSMWATHNGRPVDDGGRPIIVVYNAAWFTGLASADAMWSAIKTAFQNDFKDSHGAGINPFIILEASWFYYDPDVANVVDGQYGWGAALFGLNTFEMNNYRVSAIGPGFDNRVYLNPSPGSFHYRNQDVNHNSGPEDYFLTTEFAKMSKADEFNPDADTKHLILIETWNELWEGTAVERCSDYPANAGGYLSPTFYINRLKRLVNGYKSKDDLLASWDGQGVFYRNSDTNAWVKLSSPADMICRGDLYGDGVDDLIGVWPSQGGVWVRNSSNGSWAKISTTATHIATGDMTGEGRVDFLGTWDNQGVYYRDSIGGSWVKMATPASLITAGDLDGDGKDDLIGIWPSQSGVWVKYSKTESWSRLSTSARDIASGDMNGDGRDELLATWDGQGVFYRNSETGAWIKMANPADQVTCGDVDGDRKDDLIGIWPGQAGVWVKYASSGAWGKLSSTAKDISAGRMRGGAQGGGGSTGLLSPLGKFGAGPELLKSSQDLSSLGPGGMNFVFEDSGNPTPVEQGPKMTKKSGPGEPGFRCIEQSQLTPQQRIIGKREKNNHISQLP